MSVQEMSRVFGLKSVKKVKSGKLILLAIADNADDNGYAYPGQDKIAEKADLSRRQVQRIIDLLDTIGELHVMPGHGRGNTHAYIVLSGLSRDDMKKRFAAVLECSPAEAARLADQVMLKRDRFKLLMVRKKGDISDKKGDKIAIKGDIAMSPEPYNHQEPSVADHAPAHEGDDHTPGESPDKPAATAAAKPSRFKPVVIQPKTTVQPDSPIWKAVKAYEKTTGLTMDYEGKHYAYLTALVSDGIPVEYILSAFQECIDAGVQTWRYFQPIMQRAAQAHRQNKIPQFKSNQYANSPSAGESKPAAKPKPDCPICKGKGAYLDKSNDLMIECQCKKAGQE